MTIHRLYLIEKDLSRWLLDCFSQRWKTPILITDVEPSGTIFFWVRWRTNLFVDLTVIAFFLHLNCNVLWFEFLTVLISFSWSSDFGKVEWPCSAFPHRRGCLSCGLQSADTLCLQVMDCLASMSNGSNKHCSQCNLYSGCVRTVLLCSGHVIKERADWDSLCPYTTCW